jgi:ABC-type multidrug transport system permease subunit
MLVIFELMSIIGQLVDQQFPHLIAQRSLYEARERPAKTYSWKVFMFSQILVEMPWYTLASMFMWLCSISPSVSIRMPNATDQGTKRGTLIWLLLLVFLLWVSTFAHLCISFAGSADDGGVDSVLGDEDSQRQEEGIRIGGICSSMRDTCFGSVHSC